ncbi:MAG: hypothetical protein HYZ37_10515 [Candidatus Solibacter usitatus]|nr:hypothetical protein [Candidatus Solibacter usitatus]
MDYLLSSILSLIVETKTVAFVQQHPEPLQLALAALQPRAERFQFGVQRRFPMAALLFQPIQRGTRQVGKATRTFGDTKVLKLLVLSLKDPETDKPQAAIDDCHDDVSLTVGTNFTLLLGLMRTLRQPNRAFN